MRILTLIIMMAGSFSFALSAQTPAPPNAEEGDIIDIDGVLYEVWEGELVRLDDEIEAGDEKKPKKNAKKDFSMTVTGSRVDASNNKAVRTDVISKETIEESGAKTLSDVVQRAAGVQISTPTGTGENVTIDGLDGKYVKILIDGRPVNGITNSRVDLSRLPIATSDIERVEIVRGPMSALYGTDAMGGVINIITKRPRAKISAENSVLFRLDQSGLIRSAFDSNVSGGLGAFALKLNAGMLLDNATDRATVTGDTFVLRPDGANDTPAKRRFNFSGEARVYPNDDWSIRTYAGVIQSEVETRFSNAIPFRDHTETLSFHIGTQVEISLFDDHQLKLDSRLDRFSHRFEKLPDGSQNTVLPFCRHDEGGLFFDLDCPAPANVRSRFIQNQWRSELTYSGTLLEDAPFAKDLRFASGAVFTLEKYKRDNDEGENSIPGGQDRTVTGAYAELGYKPFDFLTIIPGARAEFQTPGAQDDAFAWVLSPKLATRIDLGFDLGLRASYGTGFRFADVIERTLRFDHSDLGYVVEGNPDLVPESNQGVRAELVYEPKFAKVGAEWFANFAENFVEALPTGRFEGAVPVFSYLNLPRVFTQGVNLNAQMNPLYGFSLEASVQFLLNAQDSSDCPEDNPWFCSENQGARRLPLRPSFSGHLGARYKIASTGTGLFSQADFMNARVIDADTQSPGFFLLSAGVTQSLSKHLNLQATFGNLLDAYDPRF